MNRVVPSQSECPNSRVKPPIDLMTSGATPIGFDRRKRHVPTPLHATQRAQREIDRSHLVAIPCRYRPELADRQ